MTQAGTNVTQTLCSDKTVKILPTDKGRATVIMKATEYDTKIAGLLGDDNTYKKLERDPPKMFKRKLVNTMKESGKEPRQSQVPYTTVSTLHQKQYQYSTDCLRSTRTMYH